MGNFLAANKCVSCGTKIGTFSSYEICRQGSLCNDCFKKASRYPVNFDKALGDEINQLVEKANFADIIADNYQQYEYIGQKFDLAGIFDNEKQIAILPHNLSASITNQGFWPIPFDDIISAELLRNNKTLHGKVLEDILIGGMAFGALGASMSALAGIGTDNETESIHINVSLRNYPLADYKIILLNGKNLVKQSTIISRLEYGAKLVSRLNEIAGYSAQQNNDDHSVQQPATDDADQLRKFKALLDEGIITEAEFLAKKSQILGL